MKRLLRRTGVLVAALLIAAIGLGVTYTLSVRSSELPIKQYFSRDTTNAVWDWSNPLSKSDRQLQDTAKFMFLHQINTVYVDAGRYAEFSVNMPSAQRDSFDTALDTYITTMNKRGIRVYAAAGDKTWSNYENWQKPVSVLQNVERFNDTHPSAQFAGIEFDIEAYNQPDFVNGSMTAKSLILGDYLDMVDHIAVTLQNNTEHAQKLELGFAIPYWYDNENGNIPSITWRGQTGPTLYHLLDRLNKLPHSNIVVMSYRNAASGNDGIIAHSRTEVDYSHAKASQVAVIIGQEVNDVEPAKITYYGKTTTELSSQFKLVHEEFQASGTFKGIAINDLTGYMELDKN
jgi:hypothetical protein